MEGVADTGSRSIAESSVGATTSSLAMDTWLMANSREARAAAGIFIFAIRSDL